jgi:DNA-binding GntR family transcriptional regulator
LPGEFGIPRQQHLKTAVATEAVHHIGAHPATYVIRLQNHDGPAGLVDPPGRGEPSQAGPDHDRVEPFRRYFWSPPSFVRFAVERTRIAIHSPTRNNDTMSPTTRSPYDDLQLTHSSTVDRVADELRRAVFDGELEAGTPLREVAIADSLGVARSTVREALALLVAEGVATREPNRGVAVASPDPDSVTDVIRARGVLEIAGVRNWTNATDEARAAVGEALTAYTRAVRDGGSYQQLNERHLALHLALVALTGSPRLVSMAESLIAELKVALAQIDRVRRNAHDQAGSHTHLLEMLESNDIDAAVTELEQHLSGAEVAVREAIDKVTASRAESIEP